MKKKRLLRGGALLGAVLLLIQLIPYGRAHTNPSARDEPRWDNPETRALAVRACYDCHSNETRWPWYANVAPVSWLVQRDVEQGRRALNFSEWTRPQEEADEAAKMVRGRDMPLAIYPPLHPEARLGPPERERLAQGLAATIGSKSVNDAR